MRSPEWRRLGLPGSSMWPFDLVPQEGGWTGGGEVAKCREGRVGRDWIHCFGKNRFLCQGHVLDQAGSEALFPMDSGSFYQEVLLKVAGFLPASTLA